VNTRLAGLNNEESAVLAYPPLAVRSMLGKKLARATAMLAFADMS